jgi:hypothetical protein
MGELSSLQTVISVVAVPNRAYRAQGGGAPRGMCSWLCRCVMDTECAYKGAERFGESSSKAPDGPGYGVIS